MGDKIKVFLIVVAVVAAVSSLASIEWRTRSTETILKFVGLWHPTESGPDRSFEYINPDLLRKSQAEFSGSQSVPSRPPAAPSSSVLASPSPAIGAPGGLPPLPPLPKPGALGVKTVSSLPPVPRTGTLGPKSASGETVGGTYVNFLEGIFKFLTSKSSK